MLRVCVKCGAPASSRYCRRCKWPKREGRLSGWEWRRRRDRVLARDRWVCQICGGRAVTADHIVRVADGGSSELANLRAVCDDCNLELERARR
jgi:5-methylcytosine-specific restriction endonuclease McrA